VYVQPFPPTGRKHLVSINGGLLPTWRGDGRELFFVSPDSKMMAVTVNATADFEVGVPQALFPVEMPVATTTRQFAVSRDGQRFLVNARSAASIPEPLTVVVNWLGAVQK
jgi:hypothetical protein